MRFPFGDMRVAHESKKNLLHLLSIQGNRKMFTIDQIEAAVSKVRGGADFPQLVRDLKARGVVEFDTLVVDGGTQYHGAQGFSIAAPGLYPPLDIQPIGSSEQLRHAIKIHQAGQTDYPTFCVQVAAAGVEKWTVHCLEQTVTYFDGQGKVMLVEHFA